MSIVLTDWTNKNRPVIAKSISTEQHKQIVSIIEEDDTEPFFYKEILDPFSNTLTYCRVTCRAIDDKRILPSDWPDQYYTSAQEAQQDLDKCANIGYIVSSYQHIITIDDNNFEPYINATKLADLWDIATKHKHHRAEIETKRTVMTGRKITSKSIIVVLDMDNNVVDIRPSFFYEQEEYQLINHHDDCHERFLLHVTTDNTEQEILQDVYDNHIVPHLIAEESDTDATIRKVILGQLLTRNFYNVLK